MKNKMIEKIISIQAFIKRKLGFCNTKGCWKKADYDIEIPIIKAKRCLCEKHLKEFMDEMNK